MKFPPVKELLTWDKKKTSYYLARLYIAQCIDPQRIKGTDFKKTLFPIRNWFYYHVNNGQLYMLYDWIYDAYVRQCNPVDVPMERAVHYARRFEEKKRNARNNALRGNVKEYGAYSAYLEKMGIHL